MTLGFLIALLPIRTSGQELAVAKSAGNIEIKVKLTSEPNYLLTAADPIEFTVSGPAYLRIYTRLRWLDGLNSPSRYELILDSASRVPRSAFRAETLSAEKSSGAHGPNGEAYARWRSFNVRVPAGRHSYRLRLGAAESETVAVRFAFETPRPWNELTPEGSPPLLRIRDEAIEADWYRVNAGEPLKLTLIGPARLMIAARLNYRSDEYGPREFELSVYEGEVLIGTAKFAVLRSKKSECLTVGSLPTVRPSVVRRWRVDLPAGEHGLTVKLQPDNGRTGTLRFFSKPGPQR